jgi:hypothetical protein
MSDISVLAQQAALFLAPFIPYLIKGGIETAKGAAGKVGELATEKGLTIAQSMWSKLSKHEEVKKAAETVAELPDDADAQAALRLHIKLAIAADPALVEILERLLAEATVKGAVTAKGSRSVAIGGSVKDSVIITGDRNRVKK